VRRAKAPFLSGCESRPALSLQPVAVGADDGGNDLPGAWRNLGFHHAEQVRYNERTAGERVNGRLKDEFGGRHVRVRGAAKVMCHCMFAVLALTADQLVRLVT